MSKTIEQLEQEAKQARENLIATIERDASPALLADDMIIAAVAMVTYQFALGIQEVSGDGSGQALPEVSQEERDSDGWTVWHGGERPIENSIVRVKFRNGEFNLRNSDTFCWEHSEEISTRRRGFDIIAYRIVK